jgi:hypothetical protein
MKHITKHEIENTAKIAITTKFFNSLQKYAGAHKFQMEMFIPLDSTIESLIRALGIPSLEVHLVIKNGRAISWPIQDTSIAAEPIINGDVIALSGPVPFNWRL